MSEKSGGQHLDLGIHASKSEQLYALQQLRRFLYDRKDIYYHRYLNMLEILGSYNELIEE